MMNSKDILHIADALRVVIPSLVGFIVAINIATTPVAVITLLFCLSIFTYVIY